MNKISSNHLPISDETLISWDQELVPENDLFFFRTMEEVRALLPNDVLSMPRKEFFSHNAYSTINYINAYWYWNISKAANYVCVLPPSLFPCLPDEKKKRILTIQQEVGRGLIVAANELKSVMDNPENGLQELLEYYTFISNDETYIAFQRDMWTKLPSFFKKELLASFSKEFIDEVYELSAVEMSHLHEQFPQIVPLVNRFPNKGGANCFASVLAATTADTQLAEWLASQWVAQNSLLVGLEQRGYQKTNETFETIISKDVLLWKNEQGTIIHGAFYLGNGLVFNKNGQMFFNPWQVLRMDVLEKSWGSQHVEIWRQF